MEKELDIYYDHYKDTFSLLRKYLDARDKYFRYLVFLMAVLLFNSWLPSDFTKVTQVILKKNIGISDFSNFMLIDSLLLFRAYFSRPCTHGSCPSNWPFGSRLVAY
ncbi:MAG: hypothetical protein HF982_04165 [Desulfobacteraceae bacterium]|nr:hypothetical protein [Desulfobacteraceae bacterium]MBC2718779.1 hypothetical protein [Desulfobacteraceae bacterium]